MYQGKYAKTDTPARKKPSAAAPVSTVGSEESTPASETRTMPVRRRPAPKKKSIKGTVIFYSIYAAFIIAFFVAISLIMDPLKDWLIKYEASQPAAKRDEVYAQLFENPDWEEIYELAGVEDTTFDNSKTFGAYMTALVGDEELTCLETSAGLSGDKKFIIKLGDKKIASFTLTGGAESQTDIPEWSLGKVEVFFSGNESVIVEKLPGHTVYINGVALDHSYTIREVSTLAENYLPDGMLGYRLEQQQVTGLLTAPTVRVTDASGSEVPVALDPETGIYQLSITEHTPSEEEKALAMNATTVYAKYMIKKASLWDVQQLFDTNSQFYKTISKSEVGWVQASVSYEFKDAVYSEYYRYSDTLFSIKLDMVLEQTRGDGSKKTTPLNNTLFFQKNDQGKWMVMEATNISVQEQINKVRILFMKDENTAAHHLITEVDANIVYLPAVTPPEGKVLTGWAKREVAADGKITMTMVFEAAENYEVYLPDGNVLEPMVLYAVFEDVK